MERYKSVFGYQCDWAEMRISRTELTAWITLALILALCGLSRADDRPRAPIPRAPLPSPATPAKPEQSDLHSHVCPNRNCRHEWWHDPTKGPVSHNCPKCGREQWTINRHAPTGARSTAFPAASLQQVVRAPVSDTGKVAQKVVCVVGSTTCGACVAFRKKHGDGDPNGTRYVYAYVDRPKPADFDNAAWAAIVRHNNTLQFTWPFFVVRDERGEFVASQGKGD